uniref:GRIP domain-containing protein n=1 Tax=Steinernema glaseri TaxID=37863 RepID=A0A1I8A7J0_9BILA
MIVVNSSERAHGHVQRELLQQREVSCTVFSTAAKSLNVAACLALHFACGRKISTMENHRQKETRDATVQADALNISAMLRTVQHLRSDLGRKVEFLDAQQETIDHLEEERRALNAQVRALKESLSTETTKRKRAEKELEKTRTLLRSVRASSRNNALNNMARNSNPRSNENEMSQTVHSKFRALCTYIHDNEPEIKQKYLDVLNEIRTHLSTMTGADDHSADQ